MHVPSGMLAARWLVARRRGRSIVPLRDLAFGAAVGFVAARFGGALGGEMLSLAIVIGGAALLIDGALRRTTAPATLLSPWWRFAIGTSAPAIVAWALADATGIVLVGIGGAAGPAPRCAPRWSSC